MTDHQFEIVNLDVQTVAAVARTCRGDDPAAIGAAMASAFGEIMPALAGASAAPSGAPMAAYYGFTPEHIEFDVCMPINPADAEKLAEPIKTYATQGGKSLKAIHKGPYENLGKTYDAIKAHITSAALEPREVCYEVYITDPGSTAPEDLLTEIYFPLK